jgi:hypothetical protein
MRNFNHLDFCNDISSETARIRFIDIQNPSISFLHRLLSFTLFQTWELHSITVAELKCLFAMVHRIKYTPVADIVDYFKEIHTLSRPIECTSLVTRIALNIGCPKMHKVAYIEGGEPILGLSHFVHTHVLREEPDHSISMLCEGGNKVLRLPNQAYLRRSCDQLIMQLNKLENARCSISGPPCTRRCARREAAGQTPSQPQWDIGHGSRLLGYQEGGSLYYPHGTLGPSHRAEISTSAKFPHWYYPLERYISYGVDQSEHAMEGIGRIESRMDEFEHV